MAATATAPDRITLVEDTTLTWYDPTPEVHYGFCKVCGATLFWRSDDDPDKFCIAAGTLDQPTGLRTTKAWWVSEHADYHEHQTGLAEFGRDD